MLKHFLLLLIVIYSTLAFSAEKPVRNIDIDFRTLEYIQTEFFNATESEEAAEQLLVYFRDRFGIETDNYPPKLLAYYGALEAVQAKYTFNPFSKFKHVTSGIKKLDKAVELSPEVLEIRFLRLAVLHNIPGIFGVSDDRQTDLDKVYELLLVKNYSDVSVQLQRGVVEFLLQSERLSEEQSKNLLMLYPDILKNE